MRLIIHNLRDATNFALANNQALSRDRGSLGFRHFLA